MQIQSPVADAVSLAGTARATAAAAAPLHFRIYVRELEHVGGRACDRAAKRPFAVDLQTQLTQEAGLSEEEAGQRIRADAPVGQKYEHRRPAPRVAHLRPVLRQRE